MHSAGFATFVLLEDDLVPSWPAMLSWARDVTALEARGFHRCFFRTEFRPEDGGVMMKVVPLLVTCVAWWYVLLHKLTRMQSLSCTRRTRSHSKM